MDAVELKPGWLETLGKKTQAEVRSWPAEFQPDAPRVNEGGNCPQSQSPEATEPNGNPPRTE
jgi:hypothetical protein